MARDYVVKFDTSGYEQLDQFALLACQSYNLGNASDWFGTFRGGLFGFYARLHGVATHYYIIHAWLPRPRGPTEIEYHLSSIFFNMDSAMECLTFAINALGNAISPRDFRSVADVNALKQISPRDILGDQFGNKPRQPLAGYPKLFPTFQAYWLQHRTLLQQIVEQHDVSKHRKTIFVGGQARLDPPPGFYEALGCTDDPAAQAVFWPMAEIILMKDPKRPAVGRSPQTIEEQILLEEVVPEFIEFVNETGRVALADAKTRIVLPVQSLR